MKTLRLGLSILFLSLIFGCSHQLEIKNLHQYKSLSLPALPKDLSVGVISSNSQSTGQPIVAGTAQGLTKYAGNVIYPYQPSQSRKVDVISKIFITPQHRGSGWNFLINFPGFLIWTPAWNGYVYNPSYNVDVEIYRGSDNMLLDSFSIPIALNIRHAEFDRTWTEISWLEVGIIAFIGGFVFIQYDTDVTPILEREIKVPIGDYIAGEIAEKIAKSKANLLVDPG